MKFCEYHAHDIKMENFKKSNNDFITKQIEKKIKMIETDIEDLKLESEYSLITGSWSIGFIRENKDATKFLDQIHKHLIPGGIFLIKENLNDEITYIGECGYQIRSVKDFDQIVS